MQIATSIWHVALRNPMRRGVGFKFIGQGSGSLCPKAEEIGAKDENGNFKYPNVPNDAVWIRSSTSSNGCAATVGWIPGVEPTRDNLRCNPAQGITGGLIHSIVHELGTYQIFPTEEMHTY